MRGFSDARKIQAECQVEPRSREAAYGIPASFPHLDGYQSPNFASQSSVPRVAFASGGPPGELHGSSNSEEEIHEFLRTIRLIRSAKEGQGIRQVWEEEMVEKEMGMIRILKISLVEEVLEEGVDLGS